MSPNQPLKAAVTSETSLRPGHYSVRRLRFTDVMSGCLKLACLALLGVLCACNSGARSRPEPAPDCDARAVTGGGLICDVSLIRLIADPGSYDGKRVRLAGFMHLDFEANGLYVHKEDKDRHLYKNGLWVSVGKIVESAECQDAYVLIEGTFHARDRGHMSLWSGSVSDITRCVRWFQ